MFGFKIISIKIKNIQNDKYYISYLLEGFSLKGIMIDHGEIIKSFFIEGNSNYSVIINNPMFKSYSNFIVN